MSAVDDMECELGRRRTLAQDASPDDRAVGSVRIVYNKLLGGWYVVRGPHDTPIGGRHSSKEEAAAWLARRGADEAKDAAGKKVIISGSSAPGSGGYQILPKDWDGRGIPPRMYGTYERAAEIARSLGYEIEGDKQRGNDEAAFARASAEMGNPAKDAEREPDQRDLDAAARGLNMVGKSIAELKEIADRYEGSDHFGGKAICAAAKQMIAAKRRMGARED